MFISIQKLSSKFLKHTGLGDSLTYRKQLNRGKKLVDHNQYLDNQTSDITSLPGRPWIFTYHNESVFSHGGHVPGAPIR